MKKFQLLLFYNTSFGVISFIFANLSTANLIMDDPILWNREIYIPVNLLNTSHTHAMCVTFRLFFFFFYRIRLRGNAEVQKQQVVNSGLLILLRLCFTIELKF